MASEIGQCPCDCRNGRFEAPGEGTRNNLSGHLGCCGCPRPHQVYHRLGLRQVYPPVQEGPQCELAPLCHSGTLAKAAAEYPLQGDGAAVAVELHHVLACEGARAAHQAHERLVKNSPRRRIGHAAVDHPVAAQLRAWA